MEEDSTPILLFKYGGNAMTDPALKHALLDEICQWKDRGYHVVIVHGGGPFIQDILQQLHIKSEFVDGLRKTSAQAMTYIEMALKGQVNGDLVSLINALGHSAVGLSGKDGKTVLAEKIQHTTIINDKPSRVDLGFVGKIKKVDITLLKLLLDQDYIPVVACIGADDLGRTYNINGDIMAGHLAGALKVHSFVLLTDVNGLYADKNDPATKFNTLLKSDIPRLVENGTIQGGMLPKLEACVQALEMGAGSARIMNGTKPELMQDFNSDEVGTKIINA
jgi:acetylglutamate kinase